MEQITYTVKQGDTLNRIAQQYGYNNYKEAGITGFSSGNPDLIRPGEVLTLKGTNVSTPTVVTSEVGKNKIEAATNEANKQTTTRVGQNTFTTSFNFGSLDDDINSVTENINSIMAGNFSMTNDEKLLLEGVRQTYAKARALQEDLNKRQQGGQQIVEARTGRSRYAPEIAQANINKRVQDGLDKIAEIGLEEQINLAKMRQDITDRKLKQAASQYDMLMDLRKERRDEIMDMNKFMLEITKEQRMQQNDELSRMIKQTQLANQKRSAGVSVLTFEDARRYDLPESLIGKTEEEILKDFGVSKPPQWFAESQIKAGHLQPGFSDQQLREQWDIFRNDPDIQVFTGGTSTTTTTGGGTTTDDQYPYKD